MARKTIAEGGKRDEIINAALELFLEKGFDGTTIRMIQRKVGSEVGLFYYYFKSKDEVFDIAINRFIDKYRPGLDQVFENGEKNKHQLLTGLFLYIYEQTADFRNKYADKLHWSVRFAIRERAMDIMIPYVKQALQLMTDFGIVNSPINIDTLSIIISHGIGSVIIRDVNENFLSSIKDMQIAVHQLLGTPDTLFDQVLNYGQESFEKYRK